MKKLLSLAMVLSVLLIAVPVNADPGTLYVDDDCTPPGSGTQTDPFCTITQAVNAASSGDTINVAAGTYDERLHIQEPVDLIGAGSSATTITTSSEGEYLILVGENIPVTFSDGMSIEGFTLTSTALTGDRDLIMLRASGPNSTNRIVIRNNVFDCVDQDVNVKGIETRSGGGTAHFLIENNEFINECQYGMWFNSAVNGEIKGNTFTDAKYTALALCTSDLDQIHDVDIVDNTILRSTTYRDAASYPDWSIWYSGMHIGSTVYNMTITGNTIADGNYHSIVIHDREATYLSNVHINCNNMDNNPDGFLNEVDVAVDAEYNWWGNASGPSGQGTGTGDPVSANVDYDPWMAVPVDGVCPPPADDEGPITSNVVATPNPAPVNTAIVLTANVDDSTTGGSNIASAEYSLDGETWGQMSASDSSFDSPTENVNVTFSVPGAGVYDLCVRGTDAVGNTGPKECVLLVVYDPEGGFVTGGGWIDSPPGAYMPGPSGIVVVTEQDVGVNWSTNDTRYNGYVAFVEGPGTPPLGIGSLEMGTTASADKAQLFNYDHIDTALADIEAISYATYRNSASTNPPAQYPAINIEVDYVGDGSSYTTLVWEPIYAYGQSKLAVDRWQTWDTMAPSQTSFGGGWWSTRTIPGVLCNPNNPTGCVGEPFYVSWDYILTNLPNAKIMGGFGVNVGSGWDGNFTGAVDALNLSVSGGTVTYDFELVAPFDPTGKATFGFVSKYKKGAQTPEGQTEFVFKAADLNFHSSSYDWLVVAGPKAKFKGTGTINGEGKYKFMLTALDADINENDSFDVDRFRIKIWYEVDDTEYVVYDNGLGADDDNDNATTEIGGGAIVIHTMKK